MAKHIATAITSCDLTVTFGATGAHFIHEVTVPAGTRCVQLGGGFNDSESWIVDDLGFIENKNGVTYAEAEKYGIRVPEHALKEIQAMKENRFNPK